ncbi:MAG: ferredoxin [Actinomycetota bacterium]|nr:ferredoxin [Actinomycetota bacterium]
MPWIPRGLRHGIVTSPYPRRADGYGPGFFARVEVGPVAGDDPEAISAAVRACPTGAIALRGEADRKSAPVGWPARVKVDRGRCILCGRCVALAPGTFRADPGFETGAFSRSALIVPPKEADEADAELAKARAQLARRVRALRRSVHVRHVDAGSDGSEEWEVAALTNPVYDVQRLGVFFTASPKHADVLLVTGAGSAGMEKPLRHTYDVMPEPKVVIAVGTDAVSGGMLGESYATRGGVASFVPVDVYVPGSPPSPFGILHGILAAVGILGAGGGGGAGASRPARRSPK